MGLLCTVGTATNTLAPVAVMARGAILRLSVALVVVGSAAAQIIRGCGEAFTDDPQWTCAPLLQFCEGPTALPVSVVNCMHTCMIAIMCLVQPTLGQLACRYPRSWVR